MKPRVHLQFHPPHYHNTNTNTMTNRQPPQHQPLLPMHEEEKLPKKHRCCFCCCHLRGTVLAWNSNMDTSLLRYHVGDSLVDIISSRLLQDFMDFRSTDSTRSEHSILARFRNPRCRNVSYLLVLPVWLVSILFLWHAHSQSSPITP
jgi:hypothetical protein